MFTLVENNDRFVLIDKNPGVDFHRGSNPAGLVSAVKNESGAAELYGVHRLDTITSGLLLFAKSREAARDLARQFREHSIDKYYLALSAFSPKKKQGLVKGDMIRGRNGVWILSRAMHHPAVTQFFSCGIGNGLRLFLLRPRTGRTHQLRVALKSLGSPVLGDIAYGKKQKEGVVADRAYLHAYALSFAIGNETFRFQRIPLCGRYFTEEAVRTAMNRFEAPWALPWPKLAAYPPTQRESRQQGKKLCAAANAATSTASRQPPSRAISPANSNALPVRASCR